MIVMSVSSRVAAAPRGSTCPVYSAMSITVSITVRPPRGVLTTPASSVGAVAASRYAPAAHQAGSSGSGRSEVSRAPSPRPASHAAMSTTGPAISCPPEPSSIALPLLRPERQTGHRPGPHVGPEHGSEEGGGLLVGQEREPVVDAEVVVVDLDLREPLREHHVGRGRPAAPGVDGGRPGGRGHRGDRIVQSHHGRREILGDVVGVPVGAGLDVGGAGLRRCVRRRGLAGLGPVQQVSLRIGVPREVCDDVPDGPVRQSGRPAEGVSADVPRRLHGGGQPCGGVVERGDPVGQRNVWWHAVTVVRTRPSPADRGAGDRARVRDPGEHPVVQRRDHLRVTHVEAGRRDLDPVPTPVEPVDPRLR